MSTCDQIRDQLIACGAPFRLEVMLDRYFDLQMDVTHKLMIDHAKFIPLSNLLIGCVDLSWLYLSVCLELDAKTREKPFDRRALPNLMEAAILKCLVLVLTSITFQG